jgi:transposase
MDNGRVLSLDLVVPREVEHRANRPVFHVVQCGTFGPITANKADNRKVVVEYMTLYEKENNTDDFRTENGRAHIVID